MVVRGRVGARGAGARDQGQAGHRDEEMWVRHHCTGTEGLVGFGLAAEVFGQEAVEEVFACFAAYGEAAGAIGTRSEATLD